MELGSFAKATEQLGRSPSAISLHLRRLKDQAGHPLLRKQGRGLVPADMGEMLLGYARRLLALNDEAMQAMRDEAVIGVVGLGLPQDFAEGVLPPILARFTAAHPAVRVEVGVERTATLRQGIQAGRLDRALVWDNEAGFAKQQGTPVPLVVLEPPGLFREAGMAALDASGIPWRVVFTSPALSGLLAAAAAGLGVTPRTSVGLPSGVRPRRAGQADLPALPVLPLTLRTADARPTLPVERLRSIMDEALRAQFLRTATRRNR